MTEERVAPYRCAGCARVMCDLEGVGVGTTPAPVLLLEEPYCHMCASMSVMSDTGYFRRLDTQEKERVARLRPGGTYFDGKG